MKSEEDFDETRLVKRLIPIVIALVCIGALVFGVRWFMSSDSSGRPKISLSDDTIDPAATIASSVSTDSVTSSAPSIGVTPASATASTVGPSIVPSTTQARVSTSSAVALTTTTTPTASTSPNTAISAGAAVTTVVVPPTDVTSPAVPSNTTSPAAGSTPSNGTLSYPQNPDGTPQPILLVYDTDTITLNGMVPSQAAKDRLEALAIANSQTPGTIVDQLSINPDVPIGIGVRVIELNSERFPSGSAQIQPAQGNEINRVATAMQALPNTTVVVVGHADQNGSTAANIVISSQRARAVVDFLTFVGVDPTRLSSRAAGDSDLLTRDSDPAGLALNRRTEFIFYGLLVA